MDSSKGWTKGSVCKPAQIFVSHFFHLILCKGVNEIKSWTAIVKRTILQFGFYHISYLQTYFFIWMECSPSCGVSNWVEAAWLLFFSFLAAVTCNFSIDTNVQSIICPPAIHFDHTTFKFSQHSRTRQIFSPSASAGRACLLYFQ